MDQLSIQHGLEWPGVGVTYLYYKDIEIDNLTCSLNQYSSVMEYINCDCNSKIDINKLISIVDAYKEGKLFEYVMDLTFKQYFYEESRIRKIAFRGIKGKYGKYTLNIGDLTIKQNANIDEFTYEDKTVSCNFTDCLYKNLPRCVCNMCDMKIKDAFM
jgi:hypothetical protein